ncbi:MAG: hypothetical protein AB2A00_40975 [Myxococcota bacterium]
MIARRALRALALLLVATLCAAGSCDRVARRHPLTLDTDVFDFHQFLRAGKYLEASRYVTEARREAFIKAWERAHPLMEITDVEVQRVGRTDDADFATVEVKISYLTKDSLALKEHRLFELWKGMGTAWVIDSDVPPPPVAPPETAPPPPSPTPTTPPAPTPDPDGFGGGTP